MRAVAIADALAALTVASAHAAAPGQPGAGCCGWTRRSQALATTTMSINATAAAASARVPAPPAVTLIAAVALIADRRSSRSSRIDARRTHHGLALITASRQQSHRRGAGAMRSP